MRSADELYKFHVTNLRAVDLGLHKVGRLIRSAISTRDNTTTIVTTRLYALLLGVWSDCLLALNELLENDLRAVIELRNKLAHGQWEYTLNSTGDEIAQEQMKALHTENLLSLQFKKALLVHTADAIHDLVVSRPTFERDFDRHYRYVTEARRNLRTRDYNAYEQSLREKYDRGRTKRLVSFQDTAK